MIPYDSDEAQLRAWRIKLAPIVTKRRLLKNELMAPLNRGGYAAENLSEFNRLRNELLLPYQLFGPDHQQGFSWTPSFFWWFFPLFWLFPGLIPQGSQLRKALEDVPAVEEREPLSRNDVWLEDDTYQTALFENPADALKDLIARFATGKYDIHAMLERVHALKYRLDSDMYSHLLKKLYHANPVQTTLYFYQVYKNRHHDTLLCNDFVECHMLAEAIMTTFVRQFGHVNLQMEHGLELLILLTLVYPAPGRAESSSRSNDPLFPEKYDPFFHFLQVWANGGKQWTLCSDVIEQLTQKINSGSDNRSLLNLLRSYWNQYPEHRQHPLLKLVARQLLEQLYKNSSLGTQQDEIWHRGHSGYQTIAFLNRQYVKALPADEQDSSLQKQWIKALTPVSGLTIPAQFRQAECFAVLLIQAVLQGNYPAQAYFLRTEFSATRLTNPDLQWIVTRVETVKRACRAELKHVLQDVIIYDRNQFDRIAALQPATSTPSHMLDRMEAWLAKINKAAGERNAARENHYVERVLTAFHQCLRHPDLSARDMGRLYNGCLPALQDRYITNEVYGNLRAAISLRQSEQLRWDSTVACDASATDYPFESAKECLDLAMDQRDSRYKRDFEQERLQSSRAVAFFARYMTDPQPALNDMALILLANLAPYLTNDCLQTWRTQLAPASRVSSATSTYSLFHTRSSHMAASSIAREGLSIQN